MQPSGGPAGIARHLCRPGHRAGHRPPEAPRRHRVELMPVHAFVDDRHLVERGLRNYWGYNSIGFFAPDHALLAPRGPISEFKTMVKTLHSHGIEVILDVVYNHTAEGNQLGPTLSLPRHRQRRLLPAGRRRPRATTWTTPAAATRSTCAPARAAADHGFSLRYWVLEMHVDGFRFDLASALARELHEVEPPRRVLRHHPPGPGAVAGQADRRALGPRRGRLSGRQFPGRLGRMERPLPRHHARLLEGRRRPDRRVRPPPDRIQRPLRAQRPQALRQHQLHHRARRLHAARPGQLQRQAQRGQRRRQPRRHRQQQLLELRRRRRDRRRGNHRAARATETQPAGDAVPLAGRADAARPATRSAAPRTATTTPTARTTRSAGWTGTVRRRPAICSASCSA